MYVTMEVLATQELREPVFTFAVGSRLVCGC